MIKVGDKVKIVYSYQLADMGLITLVNRMGDVLDKGKRNQDTRCLAKSPE